MLTKLASYYNTNTAFHSFVQGALAATIAFFASWTGGVPTSKQGWWMMGAGVGKALFSWWTRWAQSRQNVSPVSASVTPAPPTQVKG
jgi:drug/metabolite transporter (DMT)-like permease